MRGVGIRGRQRERARRKAPMIWPRPTAQRILAGMLPNAAGWLRVAELVLSIGVITLLFAMIYKVLPDAEVAWGDVWVGAAATALLFTVGKFLIGLYLGSSSIGSAYGAAGSLAVFLVWVYYSAQILFLGAEFTHAFAERLGSRAETRRAREGRPRGVPQPRAV